MATKTYAPGEPCWVDCGTDLDKAVPFYTALLGWEVTDLGAEAGGYRMAAKDGKVVAGLGPQQNPGPPAWNVYFAVEDADKTTQLATERGATALMAPTDVMTAGRMVVLQDPVGAVFSVWQPKDHPGFEVTEGHGTFCWAELVTTDTDASADFYTTVLPLTTKASDGGGMAYTEFLVGDRSVGGMMAKPAEIPAEVPPFWGVYFTVDDVDAAITRIGELGGTTLMGPMTVQGVGRFAACLDPAGAMFNVIELGAA
jgi:predicted enzyme related to lactoylglutathione lyase